MRLADALDGAALAAGALRAALVAVPAGLVAQVLAGDDDDAGGGVAVLAVVVLLGLTWGAMSAARRQRRGTPLTHGIVTAAGVFLIVQAVGVVRRTVAGEDITWSRLASSLLLSLLAGLLGGVIGSRLSRLPAGGEGPR